MLKYRSTLSSNSTRDPSPHPTYCHNFLIGFALISRSCLGEIGGQLPLFAPRGDANVYPSIFNHFWDIAITGFWQFSWANERFLPHFAFPCVRPWDNRGKSYIDRKRIQCLSNASQHAPIYLQPFLRYSQLLVENCDIFTPHLCLATPQGVTPSEFREDLEWYTQK